MEAKRDCAVVRKGFVKWLVYTRRESLNGWFTREGIC